MLREEFLNNWWVDATAEFTDDEFVLFTYLFTSAAYEFMDAEIIALDQPELDDLEPELDNDFGEVYWNGKRFVPKPGINQDD